MLKQEIALRRNLDLTLKDARGASEGITIGVTRNSSEVLNTWVMEFSLTLIVKQKSNDWIQKVTATYTPNHRDRRGALWEEIIEISCKNELSWVIGEDFNAVRYM